VTERDRERGALCLRHGAGLGDGGDHDHDNVGAGAGFAFPAGDLPGAAGRRASPRGGGVRVTAVSLAG
jgi:hypothetical protein